nr:MAG TPA: hypothetical protein [Bacteriophage sp.]
MRNNRPLRRFSYVQNLIVFKHLERGAFLMLKIKNNPSSS